MTRKHLLWASVAGLVLWYPILLLASWLRWWWIPVVVLVGAAAWTLWEVRRAPIGYEDEHGFHYGEEPVDELRMGRLRREFHDLFQ